MVLASQDPDATAIFFLAHASASPFCFERRLWAANACRHGSFYNLFDVDADIGMSVGLALSGERRGNMWKVGLVHTLHTDGQTGERA